MVGTNNIQLRIVVHTCNCCTLEAEKGSWDKGQPWPYSFKKKRKKKTLTRVSIMKSKIYIPRA